jgi:hypothetical protein
LAPLFQAAALLTWSSSMAWSNKVMLSDMTLTLSTVAQLPFGLVVVGFVVVVVVEVEVDVGFVVVVVVEVEVDVGFVVVVVVVVVVEVLVLVLVLVEVVVGASVVNSPSPTPLLMQ